MEWWDQVTPSDLTWWYAAGSPAPKGFDIPLAYQVIKDAREAGQEIPDYRGDPDPAKGGSPERDEVLFRPSKFDQLAG
jgi:hypothetical protein